MLAQSSTKRTSNYLLFWSAQSSVLNSKVLIADSSYFGFEDSFVHQLQPHYFLAEAVGSMPHCHGNICSSTLPEESEQ